MVLFTLWEIIQITITVFAVGFIFSGLIKRQKTELEEFTEENSWLKDLKYAALIAAPAVIFHELGHKFLALSFGLAATYVASWFGLGLGIALRLFSPGFLFFIPGYVSITGLGTQFQFGLVALAGPLVNLALFGFSYLALRFNLFEKYRRELYISQQINLWLFAFNMLPIPGVDGFKFYLGLASLF